MNAVTQLSILDNVWTLAELYPTLKAVVEDNVISLVYGTDEGDLLIATVVEHRGYWQVTYKIDWETHHTAVAIIEDIRAFRVLLIGVVHATYYSDEEGIVR